MVYNEQLFDMAKLMDTAAVYGWSNPKQTKSLIENVFEGVPKY